MISLWNIYWLFFKMGLFTFGGGYAMLPVLQSEVVNKRHWITEEELLDYYSVGQCTPGIIAVNAASFIGYKLRKFVGLISATFGVISPSLIVIVSVTMLLHRYMDNQYVQWAFGGIRISVVALVVSTVIDLWNKNVQVLYDYAIFAGAAALLWFYHFSAIAIVILAIVATMLPLALGRLKK